MLVDEDEALALALAQSRHAIPGRVSHHQLPTFHRNPGQCDAPQPCSTFVGTPLVLPLRYAGQKCESKRIDHAPYMIFR